ncbi:MAG: lipopolysaccharide biosynthesis protein RfbH, partial [Hyphomicrobiales bacterium]
LEGFIAARRRNFDLLKAGLAGLEEYFILPEATAGSEPSWFGFPLTLREGAPFTRDALVVHLNQKKIGTRLLFGGNLVRQPYMKGRNFRVSGDLKNADIVVDRTFWIGVYPGLTREHVGYMVDSIEDFCRMTTMRAVV